ncbi:hypothetical protein [uncultured Ruegeria sp.]|uniref:hypothetical protein n=1 Tax=uncultured Ruegeria sp. TaxID=259304 RepID=UPI0026219463|nr:hypothetical protein [uncultured Ruegeria sp.]
MKPIDKNEFEIHEAKVAPKHFGRFDLKTKLLGILKPSIQTGRDPVHLTRRLLRDAGIDELDIERKKLMRASLIR